MRRFSVRASICVLTLLVAASTAAENHERRAFELYRDRDFLAAARALELHLADAPHDHDARLLLGLCYQQAERLDRAEAVLADAVRRAPADADARLYLARVRLLAGEFSAAAKSARQFVSMGGDPARGHRLLGRIEEERGRPEMALAAYETAIEAAGQTSSPDRLSAGLVLLKLRRPAEAIAQIEKALALQPDLPEARYHLGRAYLEAGRIAEAAEILAEAVERDDHPQAESLLARVRETGLGPSAPSGSISDRPITFEDVSRQSGLDFVLENHPTPEKYLPETMAGGIAAFDYDGDGLIDLFFTNGAETPSLEKTGPQYSNRLFHNEGGMRFADVIERSGLSGSGYSIGAAAGDYDNDGRVDLFVASVNRNKLYHNLGGGQFDDVTGDAGIESHHWSSAAGWLDYDNDGLLDLFVVNYLDWSPQNNPYCGSPAAGVRTYCHPKFFKPLPNTLYRNLGGGRFEDISELAGVSSHLGKGMSLSIADYDHDGFLDIFVTNDAMPNFLFRNRAGKTFEEVGFEAGVALTDNGEAISGMGTDFRDYDNDGHADIAFTALTGETFPLFRNLGEGYFRDATYSSRVGLLTARVSGWGLAFADLDNDGWKDLFLANAHVSDNVAAYAEDEYEQANRVLRNLANGTFADVSAGAGRDFAAKRAHRGSAIADFDNDGRLDAVVSVLGGRAELWRNTTSAGNWVRFKLEGIESNRDAVGAEIKLLDQHNHLTTAAGYASSTHGGVLFGLGAIDDIGAVEVRWPSGRRSVLHDVTVNQTVTVREPATREAR